MIVTVEYNSFTVHYHKPLSQISTTDTDAIAQHCIIILLITYLYKILINKSNKISYITMSVPLLYNIEKFNDTVIILYTVYSIYTLSGRTGSSLVWHSEGHTIEALSVQQLL